ELSAGGTSKGAATSRARTRPSAAVTATGSAATARTTCARTRAWPSATEIMASMDHYIYGPGAAAGDAQRALSWRRDVAGRLRRAALGRPAARRRAGREPPGRVLAAAAGARRRRGDRRRADPGRVRSRRGARALGPRGRGLHAELGAGRPDRVLRARPRDLGPHGREGARRRAGRGCGRRAGRLRPGAGPPARLVA